MRLPLQKQATDGTRPTGRHLLTSGPHCFSSALPLIPEIQYITPETPILKSAYCSNMSYLT